MIFFYFLIALLIFTNFNKKKEHINFNAKYMLSQYPKYNLDYDKKNKKFIHKISKSILSTNNHFNSMISSHISNNKEKTLKKLKENQIPVTKFYLWDKDLDNTENLNLIKLSKINYPIVVKPTNGTQGRNVITDIYDNDQLVNTLPKFRKNDKILIEEQVTGKNYRILVFNGKIIDIIERIPPFVKGDGVNTLEKLIEIYGESQKKKRVL